MKTILLTGASGFIGSNVLRLLLEDRNFHVRVLVRSPIPGRLGLSQIIGDIGDRKAIREASAGADVIIHLAACARMWPRYPNEFLDVNVDGTRNILDATKERSSTRIIFASSMSIFQPMGILQDESMLTYREQQITPYALSKFKAEILVNSARERGSDIVTIYPTRVFGPGPRTDANAATVALLRYRHGYLPLIEGGVQISNWAFVKDVAAGIVSAAINERPSDRYILGGVNRTLAQILEILRGISGGGFRPFHVSQYTAMKIAQYEGWRSKLFHAKPLVTPEWLETILEDTSLDVGKAARELHYRITPIEAAMRETCAHFNLSSS